MNWYLNVLKNYVGFQGRARRTEYWMFILFHVIALVVLTLPYAITQIGALMALYFVYFLATFLPMLAVVVRRLHDTGRSGWWYLINFVPAVGGIILIVFLVQNSQPGSNAYGENPKGE